MWLKVVRTNFGSYAIRVHERGFWVWELGEIKAGLIYIIFVWFKGRVRDFGMGLWVIVKWIWACYIKRWNWIGLGLVILFRFL